MSSTNGSGAAARLRAHVATLEAALVDVKAPSGFIYKFARPSKFGMLFRMGQLPQAGSSSAVEKWIAAGIINPAEVSEDKLREATLVDQTLDRLLELSREPKLVAGTPQNDNEVSTDEVPEEDLEYLFKWVASGGDGAAMLGNFPAGPQPSSVPGSRRKKQRVKG